MGFRRRMPKEAMFLLAASAVVLIFSALLSMAGLGAAFLFVPFF